MSERPAPDTDRSPYWLLIPLLFLPILLACAFRHIVGWPIWLGMLLTNTVAALPWGDVPRTVTDKSVAVIGRIAAASLTAALVGFGMFFAVLNQHGYQTLVAAYIPRGGGMLDDFWGSASLDAGDGDHSRLDTLRV